MSSHGSIEIVLYVITPDAEQKAAKARNFLDHAKRRWVMQPMNNSAQCALTCYSDNAFWLNDEIEWLADQLETLIEAGFDVSELKCSVGYTSYDVGANEDGSRIEFDIEDGKLCNWRESRVMMVECEPWNDVKFELHPETYKLDEMRPLHLSFVSPEKYAFFDATIIDIQHHPNAQTVLKTQLEAPDDDGSIRTIEVVYADGTNIASWALDVGNKVRVTYVDHPKSSVAKLPDRVEAQAIHAIEYADKDRTMHKKSRSLLASQKALIMRSLFMLGYVACNTNQSSVPYNAVWEIYGHYGKTAFANAAMFDAMWPPKRGGSKGTKPDFDEEQYYWEDRPIDSAVRNLSEYSHWFAYLKPTDEALAEIFDSIVEQDGRWSEELSNYHHSPLISDDLARTLIMTLVAGVN